MPLTPETIHLWGETLCLDYANSVNWCPKDEHIERPKKWVRTTAEADMLRTEGTLGRWGRHVGLVSDDAKSASEAELRRARALRPAVYRLFSSMSRDEEPAIEDLDVLMSNYIEAIEHASLLRTEKSYKLEWPARDPRRMRYAVATDAVALLQDPGRLERVTLCPGRGCGWLFLNLSGRRRWCSMATCGSREKMRRLHQRRKQHTG